MSPSLWYFVIAAQMGYDTTTTVCIFAIINLTAQVIPNTFLFFANWQNLYNPSAFLGGNPFFMTNPH